MGLGNAAALGKNISAMMRTGVSDTAVVLMIDEFAEHFRDYCPPGYTPWRAFVSRRFQILETVRHHYEDKHQWDEDFEETFAKMFPVAMEVAR